MMACLCAITDESADMVERRNQGRKEKLQLVGSQAREPCMNGDAHIDRR